MAIAFLGTLINASASAASLAFANTTFTSGLSVFAIALNDTTKSVTSITATGTGTLGPTTLQTSINGTGVRMEIWTATTTGTLTITVNLSGACAISMVLSEYSGVSSVGNHATTNRTDNNFFPGSITMQDSNNWTVACYGWVFTASDTMQFPYATSRNADSATGIGCWVADYTTVMSGQVTTIWASMSNGGNIVTRNQACGILELRSGGAAITAKSYASASAPSMQVARDFRTLNVEMPIFCQTQLYPTAPSSPATNSGFVG